MKFEIRAKKTLEIFLREESVEMKREIYFEHGKQFFARKLLAYPILVWGMRVSAFLYELVQRVLR